LSTPAHKFIDKIISTFNTMARLRNAPQNTLLRDLPSKDKMKQAIQWLRENPDEAPTAAARIYNIKKEKSVIKAWQRERKRIRDVNSP
jgi:RNA polymerase-interacting CarD/CdnL/TRCF family regulator